MRMRTSVLATVVVMCGLAAAPLLAAPIITIQPIQICDDSGANCANSGRELWEAAGDKIWAQAGIDLVFLPWDTYNNTNFLNMSVMAGGSEFSQIVSNPTAYNADPSATVISMWFADRLDNDLGFYGVTSLIDLRVIAIGWDAVFPLTRLDTIAHEIGHSLGLGHTDFGAGGVDNLMTSGGSRHAPNNIGDINPSGLQLDKLTAAQINEACTSQFVTGGGTCGGPVVPEPGTLLLVGAGLTGLARRLRRRS